MGWKRVLDLALSLQQKEQRVRRVLNGAGYVSTRSTRPDATSSASNAPERLAQKRQCCISLVFYTLPYCR